MFPIAVIFTFGSNLRSENYLTENSRLMCNKQSMSEYNPLQGTFYISSKESFNFDVQK